MGTVANELRRESGLAQQLWQVVAAAELQGLPRVPRPADAACGEVCALGNCRETACIKVGQADALIGEFLQVLATQGIPFQRKDIVVPESVCNYDNDVHGPLHLLVAHNAGNRYRVSREGALHQGLANLFPAGNLLNVAAGQR